MLTASQVETVAYVLRDSGEILCVKCFQTLLEAGELTEGAYPLSRFEADEMTAEISAEDYNWDNAEDQRTSEDDTTQALIYGVWHVEACGCEPALFDSAGHEIVEAYRDYQCEEAGDEDA